MEQTQHQISKGLPDYPEEKQGPGKKKKRGGVLGGGGKKSNVVVLNPITTKIRGKSGPEAQLYVYFKGMNLQTR